MSFLIPPIPSAPPVRRKVFVSYFRGDRLEVEEFVERWAEDERVFLPQIVGAFGRGLIKSSNAEYVISRIRTEQIADATVTLVLMGSCTLVGGMWIGKSKRLCAGVLIRSRMGY